MGKLWAACSVGEILREDPEDGSLWWEKDPDSEVYVYAGRYRLKAGAERRLNFILAETRPGFHLGRRRNAILRSKDGPIIARDSFGARIGYATRSDPSSGVPDFRIRYYVAEVEGSKPYDVPPVFVTCSYCNGTGERIEWPATAPARCKYCEGTTKLLSSLRDREEIAKHESRIAYVRDKGYPPHTPVREEDFAGYPA
jgi:hypothetical protein